MHLRRNPIGLFACGVFVLVSLVGQGLHFLPSASHDTSQSHACSHCHHHVTTPSDDSESTSLAEDCPICRFLAQAQIQTDLRIFFLQSINRVHIVSPFFTSLRQ